METGDQENKSAKFTTKTTSVVVLTSLIVNGGVDVISHSQVANPPPAKPIILDVGEYEDPYSTLTFQPPEVMQIPTFEDIFRAEGVSLSEEQVEILNSYYPRELDRQIFLEFSQMYPGNLDEILPELLREHCSLSPFQNIEYWRNTQKLIDLYFAEELPDLVLAAKAIEESGEYYVTSSDEVEKALEENKLVDLHDKNIEDLTNEADNRDIVVRPETADVVENFLEDLEKQGLADTIRITATLLPVNYGIALRMCGYAILPPGNGINPAAVNRGLTIALTDEAYNDFLNSLSPVAYEQYLKDFNSDILSNDPQYLFPTASKLAEYGVIPPESPFLKVLQTAKKHGLTINDLTGYATVEIDNDGTYYIPNIMAINPVVRLNDYSGLELES